jgi:hypothetical protein
MRPETCPPRARRRLASELPACASPSSTAWQVLRAAERSSSSSYSEELKEACSASARSVACPSAVCRLERYQQERNQKGDRTL